VDDTFVVDFSGGNPVAPGGLTFNGGVGGHDTIAIEADGFYYNKIAWNYTNASDGSIELDNTDASLDATINYTGLEPVLVNVGTVEDAEFNLPAGSDAVLEDAGGGSLRLRSPSGDFEDTTFPAPADSLTINGDASLAITTAVTVSTEIALNVTDLTLNADLTAPSLVGTATTVTVDDLPAVDPAQIQDAIDVAAAGAVVSVLDGLYNESLTIAKDITVDGDGDVTTTLDAGAATTAIFVAGGYSVAISGLGVTNFSSNGIRTQGDLTLSDSTVSGGLVGVWVDGGTLDMQSTIITGAAIFGVQVSDGGDADIADSEITGSGTTAAGVIVSDGNADIVGSKLTGNSRGLLVNATGTAGVTGSDLSSNSIGGVVNATATAVDASGNWWGVNTETAVDTAAIGAVDFTPFLNSGADADGGARGFDGDFSHVHVTSLGAQTGSIGRIQEGVNLADAGGIVQVHAGTYTELVTVNKTLSLRGEQYGVDARTRSAVPETIVNGSGGSFSLQANDIELDGFAVEGTTGSPLGTAIHTQSGFSGYRIANNIIQDNTIGLYLGSSGANQTIVEQNLIRDNDNPGAAGGTGIYSDQGLSNALIQNNQFAGDNFSAGMNLIGAVAPVSNVTVSTNQFTEGNQLVLFNVDGSTVSGNTFMGTELTGTAIFAGGGNDGLSITGNTITNRAGSGISVTDGGFGFGANSDATITANIINQDVSLLSSSLSTTRTMINLSQTTGDSTIDGNQVTLTGAAFGPNITAVRSIVVGGAATENVDLTNNTLDGGDVGTVGVLLASSLDSGSLVTLAGNTIQDWATGV
ncbi:MAG TPA: right-handed parallel beta-helix repeat-containing protein, partial [Lacipirellula sp.]